jgi:hypothetical protein
MCESDDDPWAEARRANDAATWRFVRWAVGIGTFLLALAALVLGLALS